MRFRRNGRRAIYSAPSSPSTSAWASTQTLHLPTNVIGHVIGKSGEMIKEVQQLSGTFIEIDKLKERTTCVHKNLLLVGRMAGRQEVTILEIMQEVRVTGTQEGIRRALWMIYDTLARNAKSAYGPTVSPRIFWSSKRDESQRINKTLHPGKQSKRRDLRPQTISFFDLPPEIRNKIYEYSILCPNLKKTKVNCGFADSEFSDPDFLETESNGIGYVKSWRGSTKVLRISRQTYMESHGYVHDTRGLIKVIPGSNRPDFPSATEPFLAAHNWKNSHLSLRPKWGIAELSQGTTYQFRRLVNLDLDLAYCVYMSATEEASLISRLARAYYCIEANTTLQTLTIKFKRYGQAAHSQAALVPIMLVIMTSLEPFITLRGNHLSIRAANRKLRPHREGVVDPYGDESLVTWFNKAREEWVQGIRASLATTDLIPDSTAAIDSPSQRKGGSGRNKYNPFAGQEKYIAKLELKRSTREATALRESESTLEDIHRMYQDEYVRPLYCRKHDDCGFSTSSRKELRRHKRLKEVPSHICGFDCNCFDRTNTFRCTWCYKLQDRKDYMGWVSHVN